MKLFAISDLHLRYAANRQLLDQCPRFAQDWLIVAGDVGETEAHLRFCWERLTERFAKVLWVPGNHELWTLTPDGVGGERRYLHLVEVCRQYDVLTPEDPYAVWPGPPRPHKVVLLNLLYDYTFRPDDVPVDQALQWAQQTRLVCADEHYLRTEPYPNVASWCSERCRQAATRLADDGGDWPTVLVNHWPLRQDLAILPRIPRFSIWCGTRQTGQWHARYNASVVVFGHLHIPRTVWVEGVRFEEVSLGYPHQYAASRGLASHLREILPGGTGHSDC